MINLALLAIMTFGISYVTGQQTECKPYNQTLIPQGMAQLMALPSEMHISQKRVDDYKQAFTYDQKLAQMLRGLSGTILAGAATVYGASSLKETQASALSPSMSSTGRHALLAKLIALSNYLTVNATTTVLTFIGYRFLEGSFVSWLADILLKSPTLPWFLEIYTDWDQVTKDINTIAHDWANPEYRSLMVPETLDLAFMLYIKNIESILGYIEYKKELLRQGGHELEYQRSCVLTEYIKRLTEKLYDSWVELYWTRDILKLSLITDNIERIIAKLRQEVNAFASLES